MAEVTRHKIEDIIHHIDAEGEDLTKLLNVYRTNVTDGINDCITDINVNNTAWEDDVATAFYSRVTNLKNGVVAKLNDSVQTGGTVDKLEDLIDLLYDACWQYVHTDDPDRPDDISASTSDPFEGTFENQEQKISDILDKIASLRFDSDVADYQINAEDYQTEFEKKTVTVNQFDKVKVKIDDEVKEMYYLGTDSKGRSYFSETLDDSATAYVSVWPGQVGTTDADVNHWAEEYTDNPYLYSSMVESQALFVLTGGNTGTLTKGNVLHKIFGAYANAQYVGDANFNTSIVFEDSYYAPEVVEKGENSYDSKNAYHVINVKDSEKVSFSSVKNKEVTLSDDYHPDIVLKPGEKINASYTELLIFSTNCTIGSDTNSVLLHYDEDEKKYYVVNMETGGYHTAVRENDATDYGYRSITVDKLNEFINSN